MVSVIRGGRVRFVSVFGALIWLVAVACGGGGGGTPTSVKYCLPAGCYVDYLAPSGQHGPEYSLTLNSDGTFVWKTGPQNNNATWSGTYSKDSTARSVTLVVQVMAVPGQSVQTLPPGATSAARLVGTIDGAGCIVVALDGKAITNSLCPAGASPAPASVGGVGGTSQSVTYHSPSGGKLTLNPDGTVQMTAPDGSSVSGTFTRNGAGTGFNLHLNGTLAGFADATASVDSAGCLQILSVGTTIPWCPTGVAPAGGGGQTIQRTTLYPPPTYTGSISEITLMPNGVWSYTVNGGRIVTGTYTQNGSTLSMTAPGVSGGAPITANATLDSQGCLTVNSINYCPR